MSYSKEQRAANAAKAASAAATQAQSPELPLEPSNSEGGETPPPRNEPRRLAMDEIYKARGEDVDEAPPAAPVATVAPAEPVETQPVEPVADPVAPAVEMVKVKVDGVESEVTKAEIDAEGGVVAYQKSKAAENRLAKAGQALAETRQTQAQIAAWIEQQMAAQRRSAEPAQTDDQFIQSKVDVIRFGTPEESATALREVMNRNNPRVDQNAITQMAVSQMQKNMAVDNFKKEFQDITSNPILLRAAISLENERVQQAQTNPNTDWGNFFRSIGNEVRSAIGRQHQPATTAGTLATTTADPTSPVSDKEARKASIVNLPTAAARAALPTESKPESREDVLNQMRKTRGVPTG